jgi:quinoprotein glucose dehydrogenase
MKRGRILWKKPLGTTEGRTPYAFNFGMPNAGGPLLTRSGLIFIAATEDARFRAFDVDTGALLWQTRLPAGGIAGPMTYSINGRQYVVVVAGGHERTDAPMGDYVVAFALHGTGALAPPPNQGFWLAVAAIGGGIVALTVLLAVRGKRRKTST